MASRERMHTVLSKSQPDKVPVRYWAGLPESIQAELIGSSPDEGEPIRRKQEMINVLSTIMGGVMEAGNPCGAYIAEIGFHPEMALDNIRYAVEIVESMREY